jgi:hypothetical protein
MVRLLLASLPPGLTIPVHEDAGAWVGKTHRVHVPIIVEHVDEILFRCGVRSIYHTYELHRHPSCLTGGSTPSYLLDSRRVIPRLKKVFDWPMKFFVMLRNPAKRAESHFVMVASTKGTPAQLKARGNEWRDKSLKEVIIEDLEKMQR